MAQAGFAGWRPGRGVHVKQMGLVGECLESVCETLRDEYRNVVVLGKLECVPAQESRRAGAQIDGHVEHASAQAADQLGFRRGRRLVMHAAQRTASAGFGKVDLGEVQAGADGGEFPLAEQASEAAAGVTRRRVADFVHALEWSGTQLHAVHAKPRCRAWSIYAKRSSALSICPDSWKRQYHWAVLASVVSMFHTGRHANCRVAFSQLSRRMAASCGCALASCSIRKTGQCAPNCAASDWTLTSPVTPGPKFHAPAKSGLFQSICPSRR